MLQAAHVSPLPAWESFYIILGSSAAVLTGLVFVVITMGVEDRARRSSQVLEAGIAAFSTPTVVHFCVVLLVSAILSAPLLCGQPRCPGHVAVVVWGPCRALIARRHPRSCGTILRFG
jgi:hypothetical protein